MIKEIFAAIMGENQAIAMFDTVAHAMVVSWSFRPSILITLSLLLIFSMIFLCVAIQQHTHKSIKEIRRQEKVNQNLHDQLQTPEGELRLIQSWMFHNVRYVSSKMTGTEHGWSNKSW